MAAHTELLEQAESLESAASSSRVHYYARLLPELGQRRILDLGCGNGYSVVAWNARGIDAIGVDVSRYRLARWVSEHRGRRPFVLADAQHLPFRDGAFDAVISSGMLEHVGVEETSGPYTVRATADQDERRGQVVAELARIVRGNGVAYLDFPNGSFPIDFWHGDRVGAFRWHRRPDALLPTFRDVTTWAASAGLTTGLEALTGRLGFRQVSSRWWGRLLSAPMALTLRVLDRAARIGFTSLPASLYPYLVISLRRRASPTTRPGSM